MNKKGLSYIDWTVSFGIFIISILALFILIGPSLYRTYSGEYLLSIAQQGLEETIYYGIDKYPIFLISYDQTGSIPLAIELPSNLGITDQRYITISEPSGNLLYDYSLSSNSLNFAPVISSTGSVITYYLLYSEDFDFPIQGSPSNPSCSPDSNLDCTFGVKETLRGISVNKLDYFFPCDASKYINFKDNLNYPEKREFILNISSSLNSFTCKFKEPDDSDNVYAMTWSDHILGEDGSKESVTVNLRVW